MFARRLTCVINKKLCERTLLRNNWLAQTIRVYGIDHEKVMYKWREKEAELHRTMLGDDPNVSKKIVWHPTSAPKEGDFSIGNIVNWYAQHKIDAAKHDQRFIPERHEILGPDLAAALFIVCRGGRVRFRGSDDWVEQNEKHSSNLPTKFDPQYILEAVDANGMDIYYEGLSNLCNLMKLKWLSLKNCKNIDDWGIDKISAEFPQLEHLDISGCENVTERGLESLYRMPTLKKLIVTNYYNAAAFELTCMMLEDCMPGLTCEIHVPEEKLEE
ncbi:hypothetical protein DMN91_009001 [Ooceraea biroi]|uniref:ATP synthase subunit s-like protein n=1 Tax=Ooceraea biroi TaxID=2015173 RepID=A0A026WRS6_OOCBI|nr:distal membrane-arm assembly complex protein 2 [Ooceraea biroi]EZA58755.1 ATP synthase subunit s-like protein [Ooceraea biroi]RLU18644.1 hypothetical protein DMN91_009001 [Ooceraea biroi]